MATFVNVYISSFIRAPNPQKLLSLILKLKPDEQMSLFQQIQEHLTANGLFNATTFEG